MMHQRRQGRAPRGAGEQVWPASTGRCSSWARQFCGEQTLQRSAIYTPREVRVLHCEPVSMPSSMQMPALFQYADIPWPCRAGSPAPSILAACQCTLAATLLLGFTAVLRAVQGSHSTAAAPPADSTEVEPLRSDAAEQQADSGVEHRADSGSSGLKPLTSIRAALNAQTWDVRLAGAELGLWAFLANACTVVRPVDLCCLR